MGKYVRAFIYAVYSFIKFSIIKIFHTNNFKFPLLNLFSPFTKVELSRKSKFILYGLVKARSGVKIFVRNSGMLSINEGTFLNHGCMIVSHQKIEIGKNVQFGPNVFIYDHDHDFRTKDGLKNLQYKTAPVHIGDNVWIGANVVILRGTKVGDNCIIGAGSVINGTYEKNSIIIQKRNEEVRKY